MELNEPKEDGAYKKSIKLMSGEIHLYVRRGSKKDIWNCSIKIPKHPRQRFSTGHKDEDMAKQFALNKYQAFRTSAESKIEIGALKWNDMYSKYQKVKYRKTYETYNNYYKEYFGKFRDMKTVTTHDVADYWEWRINYWLDEENLKRKAKESKNAMYHIARKPNIRTLKFEQNALRNIFQFARNEGLLQKVPLIYLPERHPNIVHLNKRGWFTPADYTKLTTELMIRADPTGALGINRYKKNQRPNHRLPQEHLCWYRLRVAVLIASNTGLRPMELNRIRFKDIKREWMEYSKENKTMVPFVYVNLSETQGKLGKAREAFFRNPDRAWKLKEDFLKFRNEIEGREVTEDDLVFGAARKHNKPANLGQMLGRLLEELGIREDPQTGQIKTLYSLRSFYITQQLTHNLGLPIHLLALQCGTSTKMIETVYSRVITRNVRQHFIETMRESDKLKYGIISEE